MKCSLPSSVLTLTAMFLVMFSGVTSTPDAVAQLNDKGLNTFGLGIGLEDSGSEPSEDASPRVTASLRSVGTDNVELDVTVTVPDGYYLYSMQAPFGIPTTIRLEKGSALTPQGPWRPDHEPRVVIEDGLTLEKHIGGATWTRRYSVEPGTDQAALTVSGTVTGQYCSKPENGGVCIEIDPPIEFTAAVAGSAGTPGEVDSPEPPEVTDASQSTSVPSSASATSSLRMQHVVTTTMGGQEVTPVQFEVRLSPDKPAVGDEVQLEIQVQLADGWHIYALDQPSFDDGGRGVPSEIIVDSVSGLEPLEKQFAPTIHPEITHPLEDVTNHEHHGSFSWIRRFRATSTEVGAGGSVVFQVCNTGNCLNPDSFEFSLGKVSPTAATPSVAGVDSPETPETVDANAGGGHHGGLIAFIVAAMASGFLSLLTPCVFPMIPVTASFFLKQSEKQHSSVLPLAITYCLSIIATFVILGVCVSLAFGPTAVNELANNKWMNLIFAGVFLLFGLSLMGMFELRMPSWLLTWSARREATGGYVGVFFMAITFTLVSFTCTFAFVGQILVWSAQGEVLWPVIGMLAFSVAFASPFLLLALFPSMLKKLPKSGGWMNTVKVTMGLVELAFVLKFLSVADIGFSPDGTPFILDRTGWLMSEIALALITGAYLLGFFRMSHDMEVKGISALRCLFAASFIGLGLYIAAGTFAPKAPKGWLWGMIDAFAPPDFEISTDGGVPKSSHNGLDFYLEYDAAVAEAQEGWDLLFVDFTGTNCINCRKMEREVLAKDDVHVLLSGMVRAQLYQDSVPGIADREHAAAIIAQNNELQKSLTNEASLPVYAILTPDGKTVLSKLSGYDPSAPRFVAFMQDAIQQWEQMNKPTQQDTRTPQDGSHPTVISSK
ncbi:MAG: thioredoxin family protein [Planctomycetaceae bacterium]|nr:thioredoxin family protein [Planctomycetaceae bacterium]